MKQRSFISALIGALALSLILLAGSGCGGDKTAQQVRNLRIAGQADSARALALAELSEHADRMNLWREFAYATLDIVRHAEDEEQPRNLAYLMQSGIACAAVYQQKKHNPGKDWMEISRMVSSEVIGEASRLRRVMQSQAQAAVYLKQMVGNADTMTFVPVPVMKAREAIQKYRDESRDLLKYSVFFRRLLESLPEQNPGTVSQINTQLEEALAGWTGELNLDRELTAPVQLQARQKIDAALNRATGDLNEVGYFLVPTILENGVLE